MANHVWEPLVCGMECLGPSCALCTWVVERNVCLFYVECIQQELPHSTFYEENQSLISCSLAVLGQ